MAEAIADESVTLYYREGSSDKVYKAAINEVAPGAFTVDVAWGRRGAALQTGTKTTSPVDGAKARKIFEKIVLEKVAKG